ncbi:MAG TPA: NIL domain-containing protein [Acidimicrobiales bacterium]|nr:NIL domain-containing protein [Acidimicrobiales bacterium]
MSTVKVQVKVTFPESMVRVPLLARMVRHFDVDPSIRRANVEDDGGWIVCELEGEAAAVDESLQWLRQEGVGVDLLGDILEG